MSLAAFVRDLAHHGRVVVRLGAGPESGAELEREIQELDSRQRAHAPSVAPPLHPGAAEWAARRLLEACQALRDHRTAPHEVAARLSEPGPFAAAATATAIWSVDLFFRCLPDLRRMAATLAPDHGLHAGLYALLRSWPLSAPEIDDGDGHALEVIDSDPCLARIYRDRRRSATGEP